MSANVLKVFIMYTFAYVVKKYVYIHTLKIYYLYISTYACYAYVRSYSYICDRVCENQPSSRTKIA